MKRDDDVLSFSSFLFPTKMHLEQKQESGGGMAEWLKALVC